MPENPFSRKARRQELLVRNAGGMNIRSPSGGSSSFAFPSRAISFQRKLFDLKSPLHADHPVGFADGPRGGCKPGPGNLRPFGGEPVFGFTFRRREALA